jgi:TolA-binding protein
MNSALLRLIVPAAALLGVVTPASAQYQPPFQPPVQQPAASQASVMHLDSRIGMLEQRIAELVRQLEESGNRVTVLEAELARLRNEQEARLARIEQSAPQPVVTQDESPMVRVASASARLTTTPAEPKAGDAVEADPAELAYDEGYQLWKSKKYDQAITALRAMASSFPKHRRVSWANNLAGRAMLDKGEARAAAEALLANYRKDPKGERAADSLFYLGQSLMSLGQPAQACKAYSELEAVYGSSMRGELQRLLPAAKAEARCS